MGDYNQIKNKEYNEIKTKNNQTWIKNMMETKQSKAMFGI